MDGTNTGQQGRVGRRTVAKGAAWAVPAVAVAGAAPRKMSSSLRHVSSRGLYEGLR